VLHAAMVGLVQIMDHYSLAHARLDIPVIAAKQRVNIIFKNVLDVFFPFPFLSQKVFFGIVFCVIANSSYQLFHRIIKNKLR
jgi:hypothetical protein